MTYKCSSVVWNGSRLGFTTPSFVTHSGFNYWPRVPSFGTSVISSLLWRARMFCGGATNRPKFSAGYHHPTPPPKTCLHNRVRSQNILLSLDWTQTCVHTRPCTLEHTCKCLRQLESSVLLQRLTPINTQNRSLQRKTLPSAAWMIRIHFANAKKMLCHEESLSLV